MIYGFCSGKIWQRPCSAIPACHGNIPLHHKLPLHSVKVFFAPSENVLFGNLLHKGYWGPVTVFWQSVQHFSHIVLVVIEDEYTHPLLETAIISTRFLFIGIFVTVGSGVIVLKWSFLWPDCRWWWVSPFSDHWPWRFILRMVRIWSSRWDGRKGIILSYRRVWGNLGCLWWRRMVKKWKKQSCQCQESIFERRLAHHPEFSAPQIAKSSVEQEACCHTASPLVVMMASISQCAQSWQPEPCIGHQLQWWQNYEWSTVLVITPCDYVNNLDLLQLDKNRFLSTAYLDNKCKHYTRLMFLIQEMLIVMAVKDTFFSMPCIQQVPRHKE